MSRNLGFGMAVLLSALAAGPTLGAVKTSEVTFNSDGVALKAFLAEPEGPGPFPAIVMVHDAYGLNGWVKDNAKRFAEQGYVVLASDMHRGKVTEDPEEAAKLTKALPKDRGLRDVQVGLNFLVTRPNVQKDRVGVIGWSLGGRYAFQLALIDDRIKACVICYGTVTDLPSKVPDTITPEAVKPLQGAFLGVFGEEDKIVPLEIVRHLEEALKKEEKKVEAVQVYPGAGHGFMRTDIGPAKNPEYREPQAKDAWQRIDQFFAKTLKGK
jgi:carboxymethylenebutenolidase